LKGDWKLRYAESQFDNELRQKIESTEIALQTHIENLLKEYKPFFSKLKLDLDAEFEREGSNPFQPGYNSSVSIGIIDIDGEVPYFRDINIWQCERFFLGLPVSINIPGSKVTGELLDESIEDIKEELKEYIEEILADEQ
jgi:hypothetical protein